MSCRRLFCAALKYFGGFRGEADQSCAWLLAIVRNTTHTWQRRHRADTSTAEFDETVHSEAIADEHPGSVLSRSDSRETLALALDHLPPDFREVIVLREVEGLSYKENQRSGGRAHRHGHVATLARPQAFSGALVVSAKDR